MYDRPNPTLTQENRKPWERLPGESSKWYSRFLVYAELSMRDRSVLAVYNSERREVGKSPTDSAPPPWYRAAKEFTWDGRAQSLDEDKARRQAEEDDRKREFERKLWERRRKQQLENEWNSAQTLLKVADEMSKYPLTRKRVEEDDGKTLIIIEPARWTSQNMVSAYKLASELGRKSTGLEDEEVAELKAIEILVNAGWLPDGVLEVAGEKMEELKESIRGAIAGHLPQTLKSAEVDGTEGNSEGAIDAEVVGDSPC